MRDGGALEAREESQRGGPDRPIAPDEVIAKFRDNASRLLPPDRVADLEEAVLDLERAADVRAIDALCRIA